MRVGPRQYLLAVSERTRLPVLVPARDARGMADTLAGAAGRVLLGIGVPEADVEAESAAMADAVFAVDHIKVDWNQQAVLSAKNYLKVSGFSRSGLIEQLSSKAGSGFTMAQATYAANKVGLH